MSSAVEQYAYQVTDSAEGVAGLSPYLPLALTPGSHQASVSGLVDSGAKINVLPYELGLQLGAVWERQTTPVRLTGNLASFEAWGIVVLAKVGHFPPVRLVLAWTQARTIPLILGQVNFFLEFDVCFSRSRSVFEIRLES